MARAARGRRTRPAFAGLGLLALAAAAVFATRALLSNGAATYTLIGILGDVARIRPGTPVTVAGRRVGSVVYVQVHDRGEVVGAFAVHMRVAAAAAPMIRRDSELRLARPGLFGQPALEIEPGDDSAAILQPGDTLRATLPVLSDTISARAVRLATDLRALSASAAEIRGRGRVAVASHDRRARQLETLRRELDSAVAAFGMGPERFPDAATRWRAALEAIDGALSDFQLRWRGARAPLARILSQVGALRRQIARVTDGIADGEGFPARLATDSALLKAVLDTRVELDSLIARIRKDPIDFVY